MKLKVIVNNHPKPVKPYYIYEKVGWDDFLNELYRFFLNIKVIEDSEDFIYFLSANRKILQLFVNTEVKNKPHLEVIKGGVK